MNNQIQEFARSTLKSELAQCTERQQSIFKRMYSPEDVSATIEHVVNCMPEDKLDWAMQQVQRTLETKQPPEGG